MILQCFVIRRRKSTFTYTYKYITYKKHKSPAIYVVFHIFLFAEIKIKNHSEVTSWTFCQLQTIHSY